VPGSSLGKTAAGAAAITADELIDLYHALSRPYRKNAVWMMADATAKMIRKLKDTTNQYLWQPGLQAGQPDTLFGRPVIVSDSMPAATTGLKSVVFGDLSYYTVADRQGVTVQRLNELYAATGQVGFRAYKRTDGKVTLSSAIKHLIQA
jgi:HK97 family phage major capsid protein